MQPLKQSLLKAFNKNNLAYVSDHVAGALIMIMGAVSGGGVSFSADYEAGMRANQYLRHEKYLPIPFNIPMDP